MMSSVLWDLWPPGIWRIMYWRMCGRVSEEGGAWWLFEQTTKTWCRAWWAGTAGPCIFGVQLHFAAVRACYPLSTSATSFYRKVLQSITTFMASGGQLVSPSGDWLHLRQPPANSRARTYSTRKFYRRSAARNGRASSPGVDEEDIVDGLFKGGGSPGIVPGYRRCVFDAKEESRKSFPSLSWL